MVSPEIEPSALVRTGQSLPIRPVDPVEVAIDSKHGALSVRL
jgi:hypothetical protein